MYGMFEWEMMAENREGGSNYSPGCASHDVIKVLRKISPTALGLYTLHSSFPRACGRLWLPRVAVRSGVQSLQVLTFTSILPSLLPQWSLGYAAMPARPLIFHIPSKEHICPARSQHTTTTTATRSYQLRETLLTYHTCDEAFQLVL